jgi:uncharacterized membrane protein YdjX (TVP38/TMEM64 family)
MIKITALSEKDQWMQRFWRGVSLRALIPYLVIGALLILAIAILGEEIVHHLNVMELWIAKLGWLGFLAYIILFVLLTSVFFPDSIIGIISGTLFGLKYGSIAVLTGFLLGSSFQFWLSRHLLKARIEHMITSKPNLASIQRAVRQQEFRLQLLLRLTPISPAMLSYLFGVSGVKFVGFFVACIVHFPMFFLEVYFGYAGKHIARMAGRNQVTLVLHDVLIIGGFIFTVIVIYFISRMARQAIKAATLSENSTL